MVFALPFCVTETQVVLHGSFGVVRFAWLTTPLAWKTAS